MIHGTGQSAQRALELGADPDPGQLVGPYEVLEQVARGGMATVLAVRDTRSGDRLGMKLLLPLQREEDAHTRFRREFRALSRLHHPNVLRVFEWGLIGDRPWFTMELLEGRDLRAEVEAMASLAPTARYARVESVLRQVARALTYIHERGLIHRDVTPGNIMVTPDGHARLMDFGVVKELGADLTAAGEVIGTVAYMAPEQISSDSLDARADLYSLGAVLYLMLTGRRPFSAHTLHGFMEKHLNAVPRPPSEVVSSVPAHLEEICLRLLQKDPADRFASASHLLHVLGGVSDDDELGERWPPRTVGRTFVKARIRDLLDAVADSGTGGALLLTAPQGGGKTRVLEVAEAYARRVGLTIATGRCRHQGRPFGAFFNIYRDIAGEDAPEILREVFGGSEDDKRFERYQVISAFRDLVVACAPCLVVLDDLERADPATLELLEYLIRNTLELASESVVFLIAHEAPEHRTKRQIEKLPPVKVVEIPPLDAAEVEELVVSVLDNEAASLALARRLHVESGGAPAFIADMLRGMIDDGTIREAGDGFELTVDATEITRSRLPMPASLRQALKDRLAPLSADAVETGTTVALARRRLDLDTLVEATPMSEERVLEALDELLDAQIVEEHRADEDEKVELSHGRFRDVLLDKLTTEERRRRHQTVGEVLERRTRASIGASVEELAYHFEQAGLAPKAYAYLVMTAYRHLNRSLYEESLVFLDRALAMEPTARPLMLLDDADRRLAEVHLARAQARFHLGQLASALESTRAAERLAQQVRDARLQSRVSAELGVQLRSSDTPEEAEPYLRLALERAEEAGDQSLLPTPMYQLGGLLWARGDLEGAERNWKQSLYIATRIGDERCQGYGYNGLAILAICRGQSMEARKHFEQSAEVFERLGMLGPLTVTRVNLVELYLNTGILSRGLHLAERTVTQAREVHHLNGVGLGLAWKAQALVTIGRVEEAVECARESARLVREVGTRDDRVLVLSVLGRIDFRLRKHQAALDRIGRLLPLLDRHDSEGIRPQVIAWKAHALAALGRVAEAEEVLAERSAADGLWPHIQIRTDLSLGRALRELGHDAEAATTLQRGLEVAEANGYRYFQLLAHHELAHVIKDDDARSRHGRVARALARSLAAGLPRADAKRFTERSWGDPSAAGR